MRTPPGVRCISFEPEWTDASAGGLEVVDLSRPRHLLVLTNSGSQLQFYPHQASGDATEDTVYKMRSEWAGRGGAGAGRGAGLGGV